MEFWAGDSKKKKSCFHLSLAALGEIRLKLRSRPALYKVREISKECVWGDGKEALVSVTRGESEEIEFKDDIYT